MKDILKRIYSDFHDKNIEVMERESFLPPVSDKIHAIIGPRRAGKTFFLYQIINGLAKKGVSREKILFLNFEDERLNFGDCRNYDVIFETFLELYPGTRLSDLHIFFDEIQMLPGWEKFVRRAFDNISRNLYITGSNSAMLSNEIATTLRGRNITTTILPLSFREYLKFKGVSIKYRHGLSGASKVNAAFNEYLIFGGYPEIINYADDIKITVLQNYFDMIIYRDLIERYHIGRIDILKYMLLKIAASVTKDFSVNKLYNELKSGGYNISRDTLYIFIEYIKNIFFCEFVGKHHKSPARRENSNKKAYLFDNGIISALNFGISNDYGKLLENLIFIELKRRKINVFYSDRPHECDFLYFEAPSKSCSIQAVYELTADNYKREVAGLESTGASRQILIYKENSSGKKDERFVNIVDWLLEYTVIQAG
jgi:hypothetical protein